MLLLPYATIADGAVVLLLGAPMLLVQRVDTEKNNYRCRRQLLRNQLIK